MANPYHHHFFRMIFVLATPSEDNLTVSRRPADVGKCSCQCRIHQCENSEESKSLKSKLLSPCLTDQSIKQRYTFPQQIYILHISPWAPTGNMLNNHCRDNFHKPGIHIPWLENIALQDTFVSLSHFGGAGRPGTDSRVCPGIFARTLWRSFHGLGAYTSFHVFMTVVRSAGPHEAKDRAGLP